MRQLLASETNSAISDIGATGRQSASGRLFLVTKRRSAGVCPGLCNCAGDIELPGFLLTFWQK
jgi:hypothetical protein